MHEAIITVWRLASQKKSLLKAVARVVSVEILSSLRRKVRE